MALDPSFVGRTYPATPPYEVGREKIREFATAIGDWNPAYHDEEAAKALGHPDIIAPPTFPVIVAFLATRALIGDPQLGVDYARVVHGEQRFVYTRPVRAGDRLVAVLTVENVRQAAGNDLLNTRSDISTVEGEPVLVAYQVTVVRGEGK